MARIRTIKPEFWTDEKVVELSAFARLLFIGIWNFCDDDGRMVYSPKRIKMQIFPADSVDCSELLGEIRRVSLIDVYTVDGIDYLRVVGFEKHQKIDKRSASKLPSPDHPADSPRIPPTEGIKEGNGMEGIKESIKEGNGQTQVADAPVDVGDVRAVFEFWKSAMKSPSSKLDGKRSSLIKASLKTGYTSEQLCNAISGCAKSDWHMGKNDRSRKFNSLELILRNAEKIDQFIVMEHTPAASRASQKTYHDISGMDYSKGVDENGNF